MVRFEVRQTSAHLFQLTVIVEKTPTVLGDFAAWELERIADEITLSLEKLYV